MSEMLNPHLQNTQKAIDDMLRTLSSFSERRENHVIIQQSSVDIDTLCEDDDFDQAADFIATAPHESSNPPPHQLDLFSKKSELGKRLIVIRLARLYVMQRYERVV